MAKIIIFRGRAYKLRSDGYYGSDNWGRGECLLHRAKWLHYRGPIPKGFDIHHRDGDKSNNRLSNYEIIDRSAHRRLHMLERIARGELSPPSAEALRLAAQWHASPEGLAWHSENGKRAWINREWYGLKCQSCGKDYQSPYPNKSRFCHPNCKQDALRRRRGVPVRGRRK